MGHVRSRFFNHLSANAPVQPAKIPSNSFVQRILPVTPTRSIACAQDPAISLKTRNFGGGGRGVPLPQAIPISGIGFSHHGFGGAGASLRG